MKTYAFFKRLLKGFFIWLFKVEVKGGENIVPNILLHHHHENLFFMVDTDVEERCRLLPGNATGVDDRTASGPLFFRNCHSLIGKTGVHNGKNHFMIIGCHISSPLHAVVA